MELVVIKIFMTCTVYIYTYDCWVQAPKCLVRQRNQYQVKLGHSIVTHLLSQGYYPTPALHLNLPCTTLYPTPAFDRRSLCCCNLTCLNYPLRAGLWTGTARWCMSLQAITTQWYHHANSVLWLGMLPVNRLTDYPVLEAWPVLKLPVWLTAQ